MYMFVCKWDLLFWDVMQCRLNKLLGPLKMGPDRWFWNVSK